MLPKIFNNDVAGSPNVSLLGNNRWNRNPNAISAGKYNMKKPTKVFKTSSDK